MIILLNLNFRQQRNCRSSRPEVFLVKDVLKICRKFTGEHPCRSVISERCFATLLKSQFGMGVLLQICRIFSEHLFLTTPLDGFFWNSVKLWNSPSSETPPMAKQHDKQGSFWLDWLQSCWRNIHREFIWKVFILKHLFRKKAHSVNLLKKYCVTCVFLRMVKIFLGYLICTILANTWF